MTNDQTVKYAIEFLEEVELQQAEVLQFRTANAELQCTVKELTEASGHGAEWAGSVISEFRRVVNRNPTNLLFDDLAEILRKHAPTLELPEGKRFERLIRVKCDTAIGYTLYEPGDDLVRDGEGWQTKPCTVIVHAPAAKPEPEFDTYKLHAVSTDAAVATEVRKIVREAWEEIDRLRAALAGK